MARRVNSETKVNPYKTYNRIWVFRTQKLMDLWINEMEGQISDGMWENSRGTEWLWKGNTICMLGDKTELVLIQSIHCLNDYKKPRMSYPLTGSLLEVIGDRAMEENGFATLRDLKDAWRELNEAIKAPKAGGVETYDKFVKQPKDLQRELERATANASIEYVETHLQDLIEVKVQAFSGEKFLSSRVEGLSFNLNRTTGKIKIKTYRGVFETEVSPDRVKETVKFVQEVVWK